MLKRMGGHMRTNVVAYVALFIALGGVSAFAADKITSKDIAKNAVKSKHIKASAVKTGDVADGAITTPKLADGAVTTPKIAGSAVTGAKVQDGSLGAGDVAAGTFFSSVVAREQVEEDITSGQFAVVEPHCEAGEIVVGAGGGFTVNNTRNFTNLDIETDIRTFAPVADDDTAVVPGQAATGFKMSAENVGGGTRDFRGFVLCAS